MQKNTIPANTARRKAQHLRLQKPRVNLELTSQLKRFLQAYCGDHSDIPTVSANEWKITENLVVLLEPFFDFTKTLSSDGATISVVIPNILAIDHFLSKIGENDHGVQTTKEVLRQNLQIRFLASGSSILESKLHVISTALDPRYKLKFFRLQNLKDRAKTWIAEEFSKLLPIVTEVQTHQVPAKKAKTSLQSCLAEVAETIPEPNNGTPEGATEEIGKYFTELCVSEDTNPYVWWKNIESYPNLKNLFKKYFSAPSSSVYSERLFSEFENVYEEKRSRLLPKNSEKLLFLHHNLKEK